MPGAGGEGRLRNPIASLTVYAGELKPHNGYPFNIEMGSRKFNI